MFNLEQVLLEICGDEEVLKDGVDLIESGYLDSYAFIELFEAIEDAGIDISPTQIKREDLRDLKRLKKVIDDCIEKNKEEL
jgi:aryl carrier-like protein